MARPFPVEIGGEFLVIFEFLEEDDFHPVAGNIELDVLSVEQKDEALVHLFEKIAGLRVD